MRFPTPISGSTESTGIAAGPALETAINQARAGGEALDPDLQQQMGHAMGTDFRGVRLHRDVSADRLNRTMDSTAFTSGKDIFFRRDAYRSGSQAGQTVLAHVAQQGGTQATSSLSCATHDSK